MKSLRRPAVTLLLMIGFLGALLLSVAAVGGAEARPSAGPSQAEGWMARLVASVHPCSASAGRDGHVPALSPDGRIEEHLRSVLALDALRGLRDGLRLWRLARGQHVDQARPLDAARRARRQLGGRALSGEGTAQQGAGQAGAVVCHALVVLPWRSVVRPVRHTGGHRDHAGVLLPANARGRVCQHPIHREPGAFWGSHPIHPPLGGERHGGHGGRPFGARLHHWRFQAATRIELDVRRIPARSHPGIRLHRLPAAVGSDGITGPARSARRSPGQNRASGTWP